MKAPNGLAFELITAADSGPFSKIDRIINKL